jgi:hypothetical protein
MKLALARLVEFHHILNLHFTPFCPVCAAILFILKSAANGVIEGVRTTLWAQEVVRWFLLEGPFFSFNMLLGVERNCTSCLSQ